MGKAVADLRVTNPRGAQLLSQPLPAVEAHVDGEGKPGLQAHVQQAVDGMLKVEVEVQAFAVAGFEDQALPGALAPHKESATRLHATIDGDQPGGLGTASG